MAGHIMLTPATMKGLGRCSSVGMYATNPSNGNTVVVSVRDSTLLPYLFYTVGTVDTQAARTTWGERTHYGYGQHPSVCLVGINAELYAIECHSSDLLKMCYYRVGKVSVSDKSIVWGKAKDIGCGKKPKITANDGIVIVIMEEICTLDTLKYFIANIADVDTQENTIAWTVGDNKDDKNMLFAGVEPDISVNSEYKVIAVCRSYGRVVKAKLGKVNRNRKKIDWSSIEKKVLTSGVNPTISLNSKDQIVEIHQNVWKQLSISCGRIVNNLIEWDRDDEKLIYYGEYPSIILSDKGVVLEMHGTPLGFSLFYSQGELKTV